MTADDTPLVRLGPGGEYVSEARGADGRVTWTHGTDAAAGRGLAMAEALHAQAMRVAEGLPAWTREYFWAYLEGAAQTERRLASQQTGEHP